MYFIPFMVVISLEYSLCLTDMLTNHQHNIDYSHYKNKAVSLVLLVDHCNLYLISNSIKNKGVGVNNALIFVK